jgi:hypothetical protein
MHACKITSPINNMNNYYITFNYLEEQDNIDENKYDIKYIDINDIVNYIRLQYKINKIPYVVEYDNIEYEVIKTTTTSVKTLQSIKNTKTITYKLLLNKLNSKLKLLPPNTDCEITVFFKKEIDEPSLMIAK